MILACASEGLLAVAGLLAIRLMWVHHRLIRDGSSYRDQILGPVDDRTDTDVLA